MPGMCGAMVSVRARVWMDGVLLESSFFLGSPFLVDELGEAVDDVKLLVDGVVGELVCAEVVLAGDALEEESAEVFGEGEHFALVVD